MVALLWIQIHKKTRVPTKKVMARHEERSDWKLLHTIDYKQGMEVFEVFGCRGPIKTTSEFVFLIHKEFGEGDYNCVARTKTGARFWKFLKFKCDNRDYKIEPTFVTHKIRKGGVISNKECNELIRKINRSTSREERESYERELIFEEDRLKKQTEVRTGPNPYLINTPPTGKICEMEDYREKERKELQGKIFDNDLRENQMSMW